MKKIIVVVLILAAIGVVAFALAVVRSPERKLCTKVGKLCGVKGSLGDLDKCMDAVEKLRGLTGDAPVDKAATCVDESENCAQAMGCLAGQGMKRMQEAAWEFFKGVKRSLEEK